MQLEPKRLCLNPAVSLEIPLMLTAKIEVGVLLPKMLVDTSSNSRVEVLLR